MNKEITLEYLLELYKNKNYDEIIQQADKCLDPSSMFLKAFSYLYLGRVYDGYDYVVLNKEKMCNFSINSYLKLLMKLISLKNMKITVIQSKNSLINYLYFTKKTLKNLIKIMFIIKL